MPNEKYGLLKLARELSEWGLVNNRKQGITTLRTVFAIMSEILHDDNEIVIPNFGRFEIVEKKYGKNLYGEYGPTRRIKYTPAYQMKRYIAKKREDNPIILDLESMLEP